MIADLSKIKQRDRLYIYLWMEETASNRYLCIYVALDKQMQLEK